MRELINALEDLGVTLRNMQDYLRGESWPSSEVTHAANDVIVSLSMTTASVERLRALLVQVEEAKEEVKEATEERCEMEPGWEAGEPWTGEPTREEEEGGEDIGEQVSEPEGGEVRPETPPQEPEAGAPKSRKRVRE